MDIDFLNQFHPDLYDGGDPFETGEFNISLVRWKDFRKFVSIVDCIPLSRILKKSGIRHINFFILDVEVMNSINGYSLCF